VEGITYVVKGPEVEQKVFTGEDRQNRLLEVLSPEGGMPSKFTRTPICTWRRSTREPR
jgi:hypothetical protein